MTISEVANTLKRIAEVYGDNLNVVVSPSFGLVLEIEAVTPRHSVVQGVYVQIDTEEC